MRRIVSRGSLAWHPTLGARWAVTEASTDLTHDGVGAQYELRRVVSVFISYSRDDEPHVDWTRDLAKRLRCDGAMSAVWS